MILQNSRYACALMKLALGLMPALGTGAVKAVGGGAMLGAGAVGKGARFAVSHPRLAFGGVAASIPVMSGIEGAQKVRQAGMQRHIASQFNAVPYEQQFFR